MPTDADDILRRTAAAYAAVNTYRDEGVVSTTFFGPRKRTERRPFSTRFDRSHGFMFEFRSRRGEDDWDQYVVWSEGGATKTWWSALPDRDDPESLGMALAGGTGVSRGSACRVPYLLMPELSSGKGKPRPATIIESTEAAAMHCVAVERPLGLGGTEQIWIHSTSLLIRRVIEPRRTLGPPPPEAIERLKMEHPEHADEIAKSFESRFGRPAVEVESVTTYEPVANALIGPAELRFIPPSD